MKLDHVTWSSDFSVGVQAMDDEHKKIIDLINELIDAQRVDFDVALYFGLLEQMRLYSENHLSHEESLLAEKGFKDLVGHKLKHNMYRLKLAKMFISSANASKTDLDDAIRFLRDWWVSHILVEDMTYKPLFGHGSASDD